MKDIPDKTFSGYKTKRDLVNFIKYNPVSEYPSSVRDFSFSIKNLKEYNNVISILDIFKNENLKDSFIFDFYLNEKLNEIKVGLGLFFSQPQNSFWWRYFKECFGTFKANS